MKPPEIKTKDWIKYNIFFFLEHILALRRFNQIFGNRRKKLYQNIDSYLNGNYSGKIIEVEQVDNKLTKSEFINQCYNPVLPKVFRGVAKEWNAVKTWNLDFFAEKHGDKEIILTDNVGLSEQDFEKMNMKHYVNQVKEGTRKYLRFSDVVNDDAKLKNDFDLQWLRKFKLPFSWGEDLKMFMGGKDTVTPIHVGISYFLFVQVMGKKKWIIYPPNNRIFLDARTERTFHFFSNANPYNLNDPAFPLLKYADRYEVILEAGDVLWVPSFAWHYVENLTDSIGIRYGNSSIPVAWKSSKQLTQLIFLATKPDIFTHFYTSITKKRTHDFIKSQKK